jgi:hypothetical protein
MEIDNIRASHRARPFRVFWIHTASGDVYGVGHPENLSITVDGKGLVVMPVGGQVAMIDAESVTEITYDFNRTPMNNVEA